MTTTARGYAFFSVGAVLPWGYSVRPFIFSPCRAAAVVRDALGTWLPRRFPLPAFSWQMTDNQTKHLWLKLREQCTNCATVLCPPREPGLARSRRSRHVLWRLGEPVAEPDRGEAPRRRGHGSRGRGACFFLNQRVELAAPLYDTDLQRARGVLTFTDHGVILFPSLWRGEV